MMIQEEDCLSARLLGRAKFLRDLGGEVKTPGLLEEAAAAISAPTTLDEALRDYEIFGKFVASRIGWTPDDYEGFVAMFALGFAGELGEFVNFVKEEMGK